MLNMMILKLWLTGQLGMWLKEILITFYGQIDAAS